MDTWKWMGQIVQMSNKNSIHNFRCVFFWNHPKTLQNAGVWNVNSSGLVYKFPVMKDLRASRAERHFEGFLPHPCRHATQGHKGTLLGISRSKAKPRSGWRPSTPDNSTSPKWKSGGLGGSKMVAIETKWFIGCELIGGLNFMIIYLSLPNKPFLTYRVQSTAPHTAKSFFSQHKSNFVSDR